VAVMAKQASSTDSGGEIDGVVWVAFILSVLSATSVIIAWIWQRQDRFHMLPFTMKITLGRDDTHGELFCGSVSQYQFCCV